TGPPLPGPPAPSGSSPAHLLQQRVPVGQEPVEPVAGGGRGPRGLAHEPGLLGAGDQPPGRVGEHLDLGRDPPGPPPPRLRRLGGGQRDHRHPQVHGLQQRQPQRRPAHRVQVQPSPGHLGMQPVLGQVGHRPHPRRPGHPPRPRPEQVERHRRPQPLEQVGPGHPPPAPGLVDHHHGRRDLAAVALARVDDAVLDHPGRGAPAVPEQLVEVGDVHHHQVVAVAGTVTQLVDAPLRRVVLQVDRGHLPPRPPPAQPLGGQPLQLVRPLQHDHVDLGVGGPLPGGLYPPRPPPRVTPPPPPGPDQVRARPSPSAPRSAVTGTRYSWLPCTNAVVHDPCTCHSSTLTPPPPRPAAAAPAVPPRPAPPPPPARPGTDARRPDRPGPATRRRPPPGPRAARGAPPPPRRPPPAGPSRGNSDATCVPTAAARCTGPVLPTTSTSAPPSTSASPT